MQSAAPCEAVNWQSISIDDPVNDTPQFALIMVPWTVKLVMNEHLSLASIVQLFVPVDPGHASVSLQPLCVTVHSPEGMPHPIEELESSFSVYAPWTSSHEPPEEPLLELVLAGHARQMPTGLLMMLSVDAADMSQNWPFGQFAVERQPPLQMLIEQYCPPGHGSVWPSQDEAPSVLLGTHDPPLDPLEPPELLDEPVPVDELEHATTTAARPKVAAATRSRATVVMAQTYAEPLRRATSLLFRVPVHAGGSAISTRSASLPTTQSSRVPSSHTSITNSAFAAPKTMSGMCQMPGP